MGIACGLSEPAERTAQGGNGSEPHPPEWRDALGRTHAQLHDITTREFHASTPHIAREAWARDVIANPSDHKPAELGDAREAVVKASQERAKLEREIGELAARHEILSKAREERPAWKQQIDERMAQLALQAENRALRGSVSVYWARAELAWEIQHLRDIAKRAGIDPRVIPDNPYQLIEHTHLPALKARLEQTLNGFKLAEAHAPPGLYRAAIQGASKQLESVTAALTAAPVDLKALFASAPPPTVEDQAWLARGLDGREIAIAKREADLLQIALARNGDDPAVILRLRDLTLSMQSAPAVSSALVRAATFERFRQVTNLEIGPAVIQLLHDRIRDPYAAAWIEAGLKVVWRAARSGEESFPTWMARQLDSGQLVEVNTWLHHRLRALEKISVATPMLQQRHDIDVALFTAEAAAIQRELATLWRGPRAAPVIPANVRGTIAHAMSEPKVSVADLPADFKRELWRSLTQMSVRTQVSTDVTRIRGQLTISGYGEQVATLLVDVNKLKDKTSRLRDLIASSAPSVSASLLDAMVSAKNSFDSRLARLEDGIARSRSLDPKAVDNLILSLGALRPIRKEISENIEDSRLLTELILEKHMRIADEPARSNVNPKQAPHTSPSLLPPEKFLRLFAAQSNSWSEWGRTASTSEVAPLALPFDDPILVKHAKAFDDAMHHFGLMTTEEASERDRTSKVSGSIQNSSTKTRTNIKSDIKRTEPDVIIRPGSLAERTKSHTGRTESHTERTESDTKQTKSSTEQRRGGRR